LKNKREKPAKEIRLPELEIHGVWKKAINRMSHISRIYWVIIITAFLVMLLILMPNNIFIYLWSSIKAQGILLSMLLVFSLVAVSLIWSTGQRIDVWVLMFFNMHGRREPWMDWVMLAFTQIGSGIFALIFALVLYINVNHILAYELALGTLTLWLIVDLMKTLFNRPRPYVKLESVRIVGSRASGHSFPSGHTSQTFFTTTLVLNYFQVSVWIAIGAYAVALFVGITRIYVGMHYPRDVIGGTMLGIAWGFLGFIINNYIWLNG